jgi:hypothetical protein
MPTCDQINRWVLINKKSHKRKLKIKQENWEIGVHLYI